MNLTTFSIAGGLTNGGAVIDRKGTRWDPQDRHRALPSTLRLLKWGKNASVKGSINLTAITKACLEKNQRDLGFEKIAIDFEHNTVPGTPEYERTQEPRKIAGYGTPRLHPVNGLEIVDVRWTPEGVQALSNFQDLSPTVEVSPDGSVLFIHSVALCRNGAVHGLELAQAR